MPSIEGSPRGKERRGVKGILTQMRRRGRGGMLQRRMMGSNGGRSSRLHPPPVVLSGGGSQGEGTKRTRWRRSERILMGREVHGGEGRGGQESREMGGRWGLP